MKPLFAQAKTAPKRVVYAEGEDERVLRATQVVVEEGLAKPILIGRPAVIEPRLDRYRPRDPAGARFRAHQPARTIRATATMSISMSKRPAASGVTPDAARTVVRTNATVIAAMMVRARRCRRGAFAASKAAS